MFAFNNWLQEMVNRRMVSLVIFFLLSQLFLFSALYSKPMLSSLEPMDTDSYIATNDIKFRRLDAARQLPMLFLGGPPLSGSTFLSALLDYHPSVRCGLSSSVISRFLDFYSRDISPSFSRGEYNYASLTLETIHNALAAFIKTIVVEDGYNAQLLCKTDSYSIVYAGVVARLFPNAKFLLMIRDGRAVAYSRYLQNSSTFLDAVKSWNSELTAMIRSCLAVGPGRCYPVYYEQLILNPSFHLRSIMEFIGLPWNQEMLNHPELVSKKWVDIRRTLKGWVSEIMLPDQERSYRGWMKLDDETKEATLLLAPLLTVLGYSNVTTVDNYGLTGQVDISCKNLVCKNNLFWTGTLNAVPS